MSINMAGDSVHRMMTIGKSGYFVSSCSVVRARGAKGGSMTSREIDRVEIRKDEGQRRNSTISTNNESTGERNLASWLDRRGEKKKKKEGEKRRID